MASDFEKNAVINNFIKHICVVCEDYFGTDDDEQEQVKYKPEGITKVKAGYFCEYCSVLISTEMAKVDLHVQDKMHKEKKESGRVKYVRDGVVAFDKVLISENAWHGLSDRTCAVCNRDVRNEQQHKHEHPHMMRLVKGKIEFGPNDDLLRYLDVYKFQCMTCNKILIMHQYRNHFNDSEHRDIYAQCVNNKIKYEQNRQLEKNDGANANEEALDENPPDMDVSAEEQNDNNIQLESDTAFCKICSVGVNYDEIKKHIAEHKHENASTPSDVTTNPTDKLKEVEMGVKGIKLFESEMQKRTLNESSTNEQEESIFAIEEFSDNNNISYIAGNSEAECTVCDMKLPATLKHLKEHVSGSPHITKSAPAEKPKCAGDHLQKQPIKDVIKGVIHLENVCGQDVIVNDKFCLTILSFLLLQEVESKLYCLYCDETFSKFQLKKHLQKEKHEKVMHLAPVVCDDEDFIREIRPGVYHCGSCHTLPGDWAAFTRHVQEDRHIQRKKTMQQRFRGHQPFVMQYRRDRMQTMLNVEQRYRVAI